MKKILGLSLLFSIFSFANITVDGSTNVYIEKSNNENKIKGLQYRLQNALRTNNVNLFMDILITAHAYIGKEIHKLFIRALENEDEFKTLGYAFLIGLLNDGNKEN